MVRARNYLKSSSYAGLGFSSDLITALVLRFIAVNLQKKQFLENEMVRKMF